MLTNSQREGESVVALDREAFFRVDLVWISGTWGSFCWRANPQREEKKQRFLLILALNSQRVGGALYSRVWFGEFAIWREGECE